jgi:uncharacterized DUF497 family protein
MAFVWNDDKARSNLRKHGVSFDEAASVFLDTLGAITADPLHSDDEERFVLLGLSGRGRLLVVVHTERGEDIRLISARLADVYERKHYEQETY